MSDYTPLQQIVLVTAHYLPAMTELAGVGMVIGCATYSVTTGWRLIRERIR